MSVHLLTIGGGDHNVPKAPTERVPMNAVISHSDTRGCGSSFAALSSPRAMRMPSVRAKANLHLQPIPRPWTQSRAGNRL